MSPVQISVQLNSFKEIETIEQNDVKCIHSCSEINSHICCFVCTHPKEKCLPCGTFQLDNNFDHHDCEKNLEGVEYKNEKF